MLRSDPAQPGRVSKHARYLMQHILTQPLRCSALRLLLSSSQGHDDVGITE
jgi:hypothetical protein